MEVEFLGGNTKKAWLAVVLNRQNNTLRVCEAINRKTKYNILIIVIIVVGLALGLLGYFGFMEFIKNLPLAIGLNG